MRVAWGFSHDLFFFLHEQKQHTGCEVSKETETLMRK